MKNRVFLHMMTIFDIRCYNFSIKEVYNMLFRELSKDEFQHFSNTYPDNNFWQTTNMAQMRENRGYSTSYVGIIDQNHIIAACMLSFVPIFRSYSYCKMLMLLSLLQQSSQEQLQLYFLLSARLLLVKQHQLLKCLLL